MSFVKKYSLKYTFILRIWNGMTSAIVRTVVLTEFTITIHSTIKRGPTAKQKEA